ncbi:MAG TPA: amidohydrolase family protein [Thermoanaerobaculia bacterium]|nr:amidohydrolase family protein [Thermoanaerobaculia bacterium]
MTDSQAAVAGGRARSHTSLLLILFLFALPAAAGVPGVYAITDGTVHPVSGPAIPNGVVIVRNGLIEAVGANLQIPADATVVDAHGGDVYPGLIDAQTSLGFPAPAPPPRRFGPRPPTPRPQLPETTAAFSAMREAKVTDAEIDAARATGVTTVLTAPSFGIFNGQAVLLDLGEGDVASRVIKDPASQQISFNPRPAWTFPDSLMGVIADIRQTFLDAQHDALARAIYEKNPAGNQRPQDDPALQALGPVLRHDLPAVFVADTESMMRRVEAIAHEFGISYVISGARQAYRMPDELKAGNAPLLVSVDWPRPPAGKEDREEQPLRILRDALLEPTTPSVLASKGVLFALVSGGAKTAEFVPGIRKAIENGLSEDDALRAVTLSPARIFGVDRQLGSLEKGKIANVVVTDKPIFASGSAIKRIFIDGHETRLPDEEKKPAAETPPSPLTGTWAMLVRTPQGEVNINATFHAEAGHFAGTFSGDRGSGDVRNATLEGSSVTFTIAAQMGAETGDWVFQGAIHDDKMDGTVSTTLGSFQFTGSKPQ